MMMETIDNSYNEVPTSVKAVALMSFGIALMDSSDIYAVDLIHLTWSLN